MGIIKKILGNELVGGSSTDDLYPVTSTKAVYDSSNNSLEDLQKWGSLVNISVKYNTNHIAEALTLAQAVAKVPQEDRVLGFTGTFLSSVSNLWESYQYVGDTLTTWWTLSYWDAILKSSNLDQDVGDSTNTTISQKVISEKLNHTYTVSTWCKSIDSFGNNYSLYYTPEEISNLILDIKIEGNELTGDDYLCVGQVNTGSAIGAIYNYYLSIVHHSVSTNNTTTLAVISELLQPADGIISLPVSVLGITKIHLYLNWSVLQNRSTLQNIFDNKIRIDAAYVFNLNTNSLVTQTLKLGNIWEAIDAQTTIIKDSQKSIVTLSSSSLKFPNKVYPSDLDLATSVFSSKALGYVYRALESLVISEISFRIASTSVNPKAVTIIVGKKASTETSFSINSLEKIYKVDYLSIDTSYKNVSIQVTALLNMQEDLVVLIYHTDGTYVNIPYYAGAPPDARWSQLITTDTASVTGSSLFYSKDSNNYSALPLGMKFEPFIKKGFYVTESQTTFQLENDLEWFTTSQYSYKNLGQYTKPLPVGTVVNTLRLNKVQQVGGLNVAYKIFVVTDKTLGNRSCPKGAITPETHRLLKEGDIILPQVYGDVLFTLNEAIVLDVESQVAIYMVCTSPINMRGTGGGAGNPQGTSNASLLSVVDNPFDGGVWVAGNVTESANTGYFNVALTLMNNPVFASLSELTTQIDIQVPPLVSEAIQPQLVLTIPNLIYAVEGVELNLWNDTVSLSLDRGLMSPLNYMTKWDCQKGLITDRCFRFTPTTADVGSTLSCSCYIYDTSRQTLITSKSFQIKVVGKGDVLESNNVVYFGDSLGPTTATNLIANFNNAQKFTGVIPTFLGTRGSGINKYEAVGGYGWSKYATSGNVAYRVNVTGVTSASLGAKYLIGDEEYFIREVNINGGVGNLLLERAYGAAGNLPPNGTMNLVSGSGDATINYTGAFQEPNNPLWNNDTNSLDIALYKTRLGLSVHERLDVVSFQFGINDSWLAEDLPTLQSYIDDLYTAFIADNPICKMLIGLVTSAGNTLNGAGANYGADYDWKGYLDRTYRIRQFYLTLQNPDTYPNIVIVPVSLGIDRYYGYALGDRQISQRYTPLEKYHSNYVHPTTSGYGQIADMYFSRYIKELL